MISSPSLGHAVLFGLSDELLKIAEDAETKRKLRNRKIKNIALMAGGFALAGGIAPEVHRYLGPKIRPHWEKLSPVAKRAILAGGLAITVPAVGLLTERVLAEKKRREEEVVKRAP